MNEELGAIAGDVVDAVTDVSEASPVAAIVTTVVVSAVIAYGLYKTAKWLLSSDEPQV